MLCCVALAYYAQLVEDQIEVARKTLEEAADRQPWWVRTAYLRGSLWEGAASEAEMSNLYSDDDEAVSYTHLTLPTKA